MTYENNSEKRKLNELTPGELDRLLGHFFFRCIFATNHSARKTMVETLCRANVPDSTVMQLSGHKSMNSLNH